MSSGSVMQQRKNPFRRLPLHPPHPHPPQWKWWMTHEIGLSNTREIAFYLPCTYLSPLAVNLSRWDPDRHRRRRTVQTPSKSRADSEPKSSASPLPPLPQKQKKNNQKKIKISSFSFSLKKMSFFFFWWGGYPKREERFTGRERRKSTRVVLIQQLDKTNDFSNCTTRWKKKKKPADVL